MRMSTLWHTSVGVMPRSHACGTRAPRGLSILQSLPGCKAATDVRTQPSTPHGSTHAATDVSWEAAGQGPAQRLCCSSAGLVLAPARRLHARCSRACMRRLLRGCRGRARLAVQLERAPHGPSAALGVLAQALARGEQAAVRDRGRRHARRLHLAQHLPARPRRPHPLPHGACLCPRMLLRSNWARQGRARRAASMPDLASAAHSPHGAARPGRARASNARASAASVPHCTHACASDVNASTPGGTPAARMAAIRRSAPAASPALAHACSSAPYVGSDGASAAACIAWNAASPLPTSPACRARHAQRRRQPGRQAGRAADQRALHRCALDSVQLHSIAAPDMQGRPRGRTRRMRAARRGA